MPKHGGIIVAGGGGGGSGGDVHWDSSLIDLASNDSSLIGTVVIVVVTCLRDQIMDPFCGC